MKIFISWSGELSKKFAEALSKWLPCLLQKNEVFYSPDDIEKGENWDQRISSELSKCNFGLICLTQENLTAPWINFEAGAIAKSLESRVAALLIGINPSDIKGPLSRYQATKIERVDFLHLLQDINRNSDAAIDQNVLETTFQGLWPTIENELQTIIKENTITVKNTKKPTEKASSDAVEEILQLVRKQNSIISNPDVLFPPDYIRSVFNGHPAFLGRAIESNDRNRELMLRESYMYLSHVLDALQDYELEQRNELIKKLYIEAYLSRILRRVLSSPFDLDQRPPFLGVDSIWQERFQDLYAKLRKLMGDKEPEKPDSEE